MAVARALTEHRRTRVVELVTSGLSYEEAAAEVGYANRSGAYKAFHRALADREADAIDEHRALELARLDALQTAVWDRAIDGETRAVQQALRIIDQRCRLLGLDRPAKASAGPVSVVAPGFEDEYVAALADTQERNQSG